MGPWGVATPRGFRTTSYVVILMCRFANLCFAAFGKIGTKGSIVADGALFMPSFACVFRLRWWPCVNFLQKLENRTWLPIAWLTESWLITIFFLKECLLFVSFIFSCRKRGLPTSCGFQLKYISILSAAGSYTTVAPVKRCTCGD